jgi:MFS transporter, ACS family, hexuronate transporter
MISTRLRWALFATLCLAGIFNAMDRPIIAILKPEMSADFGWDDEDFGRLGFITQMTAAFSFLVTGWLIDRLGVRRSMAIGVTAWSLAAMAHGWAVAAWHVIAARIGLGATEAIQTPLTIKTVATLFAPNIRSFAIGIGTAIAGAGAIIFPFMIPPLLDGFGWRGALVFAGMAGFVTLALWWWLARGVDFDDAAEDETLDYNDTAEPYGPVLTERRSWAIIVAKALSDATWWFVAFWLPDFFDKQFGLTSAADKAAPMAIVFAGSAIGAFLAGSLSTYLLTIGWSVNRVRKAMMLGSALIALSMLSVTSLSNYWHVAIIMAVVLAGHQGFSLSLFSIITDVVPRDKVGRITALGACAGNFAGAGIVWLTGALLTAQIGYQPVFIFAALSYLLALGWLHCLLPRIRRDAGALGSGIG